MDYTEIISNQLIKLIQELKDKHIELGMKASGKWIESLEYEVDGDTGIIWGEHYTEYLTKGREAGKRPPISPIEEWVKAKFGYSGQQAKSVAFAVATKIGKEGTTWFQKGGSDLLDGVLTKERINKMILEVGNQIALIEAENLKRELVL